jgi:hypothetical protein
MPTSPAQAARNKLGLLIQNHAPADQIEAARRELAEALITQAVAKVVGKSPPLTDEQRQRLASLILTGGPAS